MASILQGVLNATTSLARAVAATYHGLRDADFTENKRFTVIRHSPSFVLYRGADTIVPLTVLVKGSEPAPKGHKVWLVRRGWRAGLFGWTVGSMLGGGGGQGIDVTPEQTESWDRTQTLDERIKERYQKDLDAVLAGTEGVRQHAVETCQVRIPVRSGDGYFRLRLSAPARDSETLAYSPTFRLGSLSLHSACPRGATIITLIPEVLVRSLSAAAWGLFYAAFPFLSLAERLPGRWGQRAMHWAYRAAGGDERKKQLDERYSVSERVNMAQRQVYQTVPFASAGVRTSYDIEQDNQRGRGGYVFQR